MILEIAISVVTIATTIFFLKALYDIAIPDLRSGKIQARGTVYSWGEQPNKFWFCVVFWFVIFLMILASNGMWVIVIWTRLT
jgi:hypothetical protein